MVRLKNAFPDAFFEEEVRNGFTITRKRKEIWAVELDMLIELDKACKELGIRYFLDSGTLLGAARDGRFIPWDDDVDVVMLREDYDVLVREGNRFFQDPLFLQNAYTDEGYFRMHSQIRNSQTTAILANEKGKARFNQGIFIDVFVLDGVNEKTIGKQLKEKMKFRKMYIYQQNPQSDNRIKRVLKKSVNTYSKRRYGGQKELFSGIEELFRYQNETEYVDSVMMLKNKNDKILKLRREWYAEPKDIMFEGRMFPAPKDHESVLNIEFGDDWKIPRNAPSLHSGFGETLFDTEEPYTKYI